jgi:hypothetical protein
MREVPVIWTQCRGFRCVSGKVGRCSEYRDVMTVVYISPWCSGHHQHLESIALPDYYPTNISTTLISATRKIPLLQNAAVHAPYPRNCGTRQPSHCQRCKEANSRGYRQRVRQWRMSRCDLHLLSWQHRDRKYGKCRLDCPIPLSKNGTYQPYKKKVLSSDRKSPMD